MMRRREFITVIGAAAAWPLAARAQQDARVRRIGMLSEFSEAQMQPMISAFRQQLRQFGWKDESIAIDSRFAIIDAVNTTGIVCVWSLRACTAREPTATTRSGVVPTSAALIA
jgi:hypothetical protein